MSTTFHSWWEDTNALWRCKYNGRRCGEEERDGAGSAGGARTEVQAGRGER